MSKIPDNCATCPFEYSCNTAFNSPDCHFYPVEDKKEITFWARLKILFSKIFK